MKRLILLISSALMFSASLSLTAQAAHPYLRTGHGISIRIGLSINPFPVSYGHHYRGYNYSPYAYAPQYVYRSAPEIVLTQPSQIIYVSPSYGGTFNQFEERNDNNAYSTLPAAMQVDVLLYCHNPDGYYPAIKTCPSGWRKVQR